MTTAAPALLSLPRLGGWRAKSGSPIQLEGGLGAALPGRGWGPPGCSLLTAWFPEVGQSAAGKREGGGGNEKRKLLFFSFLWKWRNIQASSIFSRTFFSVALGGGPEPLASVCTILVPASCSRFLPLISCRACSCFMGSPSPLAMPGRLVSWHSRADERSLSPVPGSDLLGTRGASFVLASYATAGIGITQGGTGQQVHLCARTEGSI